jgi:2-amino-4-hydroxy-6-hydroxymethyldihydropteridine diphosphokinase
MRFVSGLHEPEWLESHEGFVHIERVEFTVNLTFSKLAWIGLGSNLGPSRSIVLQARTRLQDLSSCPLLASSLWQTSPVDCPAASPPFINAVVGLSPFPEETPEGFLDKLQRIEKDFGRQPKTVLNEPRPLDLDLILWGDRILTTAKLTLPHPRAHRRRFVLEPLAELAPSLVWPGQNRTVKQWLEILEAGTGDIVARLGAFESVS